MLALPWKLDADARTIEDCNDTPIMYTLGLQDDERDAAIANHVLTACNNHAALVAENVTLKGDAAAAKFAARSHMDTNVALRSINRGLMSALVNVASSEHHAEAKALAKAGISMAGNVASDLPPAHRTVIQAAHDRLVGLAPHYSGLLRDSIETDIAAIRGLLK